MFLNVSVCPSLSDDDPYLMMASFFLSVVFGGFACTPLYIHSTHSYTFSSIKGKLEVTELSTLQGQTKQQNLIIK